MQWTDSELELLREHYSNPVLNLSELEARLGRLKSNICRKARSLGLTDQKRRKVLEPKVRVPKFGDPIERRENHKAALREWHRNNQHPRGMLGKRHSEATRSLLSKCSKENWQKHSITKRKDIVKRSINTRISRYGSLLPPSLQSCKNYSRCRAGRRGDLGEIYFRSSWEANYARYLNFLIESHEIASWEYEPKTFVFERAIRKPRSYTPDFLVNLLCGSREFREVKGWMDANSKSKMRKMARYFPDAKIVVVGEAEYTAIEKQYRTLIANWE